MSQQEPQNTFERFIDRVGSLPGVATVTTAIVAAYMSLVAFGNITDFDSNQAFVHHVLEMDTTFNDPDVMWRAVENDTLQNIGYIGVIVWETLAAIVLIWATVRLLRAFGRGAWRPAKRLASTGLLMVLILFGFGFITIGGEYFSMWQSSDWNGLDAALRNYLLAAVPLILLQFSHPSWDED
ncbi:MAG TPA: DUF2165 domain-containing protein [Aeromicrobium sp.]|nr:DUF2165 domain-containing protein [Aeromicrobium sp.]